MNFLNTHWTWQYVVMLLFVFWTAWRVGTLYNFAWNRGTEQRFTDEFDIVLKFLWSCLATFTFHQWW